MKKPQRKSKRASWVITSPAGETQEMSTREMIALLAKHGWNLEYRVPGEKPIYGPER